MVMRAGLVVERHHSISKLFSQIKFKKRNQGVINRYKLYNSTKRHKRTLAAVATEATWHGTTLWLNLMHRI